MLRFEEVPVLDRNSAFRGVPPEKLMENAGKQLAKEIKKQFTARPIIFFCGTGNNGGDGYVAARYLAEEWGAKKIKVFLIKDRDKIGSELAKRNLQRLSRETIIERKLIWSEVEEETIFVDALLGTGVFGKIREPYRDIIQKMNEYHNQVVSVDVPSGLGADISVIPDLTVTFHDIKEGMTEDNCGKIKIKDIGIPRKAETHTGPGEMLLYPKPKKSSHKGENGRVLVIGGGPFTGAPALSAKAAYRAGVDLVELAVPESVYPIIASYSTSFVVHDLKGRTLKKDHIEYILELAEKSDSVLIGPGLGQKAETLESVQEILENMADINKSVAIDADGLKAVAEKPSVLPSDAVLTPHESEFNILVEGYPDKKLEEKADEFAKRNSVVLIVKGKSDYITDGEDCKWNDIGNEGMTVGGTGDILAGVVSALLSKGTKPFDAGRIAAFMTCRAGDIAFDSLKWGMGSEDIIEKIPENFDEI